MKILQEFRDFAMRGNVVDMAVGIIVGGAFGKIVSSLVNDVIMPPLGVIIGGVNFKDLKWTLQEEQVDAAGAVAHNAVTLNYGQFIQSTVDFAILAFAIFVMIKVMNTLQKKEEAKPAGEAVVPKEEALLAEIRDILKKQNN